MKNIILSLFLLSPLFTFPQGYHPLVSETGLWSVYHNYCKGDAYPFSEYVRFQGDVTVNDTVYKQIWTCGDTLTEPWTAAGLIREDAQKRVWERSSGNYTEYLKYDFSALPGDTLWLNGNPYLYIMGNQDSVQLLDGSWRKQYHLQFPAWPECEETWIEGIGCLKGVLESGTCMYVGDNPALICGLSHDTILFHNSLFTECHVITGIPQPGIPNVQVSPNPATGFATIGFQAPQPEGMLILTDMAGKVSRRFTLSAGTSSLHLDLSGLTPGMYLLNLADSPLRPLQLIIR